MDQDHTTSSLRLALVMHFKIFYFRTCIIRKWMGYSEIWMTEIFIHTIHTCWCGWAVQYNRKTAGLKQHTIRNIKREKWHTMCGWQADAHERMHTMQFIYVYHQPLWTRKFVVWHQTMRYKVRIWDRNWMMINAHARDTVLFLCSSVVHNKIAQIINCRTKKILLFCYIAYTCLW